MATDKGVVAVAAFAAAAVAAAVVFAVAHVLLCTDSVPNECS